jgi:hypothetical protein
MLLKERTHHVLYIPSPLQNAHPFSVAECSSLLRCRMHNHCTSLLRCRMLIPSPLQNAHPFSVAECSALPVAECTSLLRCRMLMLISSPLQDAHLFSVRDYANLIFFQQVLVRHLTCKQRDSEKVHCTCIIFVLNFCRWQIYVEILLDWGVYRVQLTPSVTHHCHP